MRTIYSSEVIARLQKNPCVWHVSQRTISYTYEFKRRALDLYAQGIKPDDIWQQAGFDLSIWKKDELDYGSSHSFQELFLRIEKYMRYYNYERKQWTRNKMTPVAYRNHLLAQVEG